jgi:ribose transport system substrate-binding protein
MSRGTLTKTLAVLSVTSLFALAGCGGDDTSSSSGGGGGSDEPSIGYFISGTNNSYVQTNVNAAKETADELGVDLEVISGNWDSATQINQFQTAMTRKTYDTWIVAAVAPDQACAPIRQAMAQGIKVFISNQSICGDSTFTEGTLGFVGGQTPELYDAWMDAIVEDNPDGGKLAMLTGPNLNANTNNALASLDRAVEGNPSLDVVSNQQSDYTTASAYAVAQAVLQANPDLKIYVTNYAEMTKGVVQAIEAAGRTGQVKVYDYGANEWIVDAIKDGKVDMSLPMLPYTEVAKSVELTVDAYKGEDIPESFDLSSELTFDGAPFVTADNVDQFKAEFK